MSALTTCAAVFLKSKCRKFPKTKFVSIEEEEDLPPPPPPPPPPPIPPPSVQELRDLFLASLSESDLSLYHLSMRHFASSFDLEKTHAFMRWKKEHKYA